MSILTDVNIWVVVGDSNTGKSTMIGHLTAQFGATTKANGLKQGSGSRLYTVLLRGGGYLRLWSRRMALQEAGWSPEFAVRSISKRILRHQPNARSGNILVALRDVDSNGLPSGDSYLTYFQSQGWSVRSIVLMQGIEDPARYLYLSAPTYCMKAPHQGVSSVIAQQISHRVGQIRNHFEWA